LLSIINDILDLSKIEAGMVELNIQPFDLKTMVEQICHIMRYQAKEKGLSFHFEIAPTIPGSLVGDDLRIRQVLLNLIGNAVKFTDRGGVTVRVDSQGGDENRIRVRFVVEDTGIGIPAGKRHHLFQKFTQIDPSRSRRHGGTGLGLSICKSLVDLMDGVIEVESEPEKGSRFTCIVPFLVVDLVIPARVAEKPIQWTRAPRILLADDSPSNRMVAVHLLRRVGSEPVVVANGMEAVNTARSDEFDLIFMDIHMPVLDGVEASRRIRGEERRAGDLRVPIIALTADVLQSHSNGYAEAGLDGCLFKPCRFDDFAECLRKWLPHLLSESGSDADAEWRTRIVGAPVLGAENGEAVWNRDEALARLENDFELFVSTVEVVLGEWPQLLESIGKSFETKSFQDGKRFCHTMKSSACYVGGERLARVAADMEQSLASGQRDSAIEQFPRLRQEVDRLTSEIRAMFPERP
jgi:CheY-like chemotaxis protein/HPt (histidine-containing phosphotransfer) domain-containing protein